MSNEPEDDSEPLVLPPLISVASVQGLGGDIEPDEGAEDEQCEEDPTSVDLEELATSMAHLKEYAEKSVEAILKIQVALHAFCLEMLRHRGTIPEYRRGYWLSRLDPTQEDPGQ